MDLGGHQVLDNCVQADLVLPPRKKIQHHHHPLSPPATMLLQDVLPAFAVEPGCELVGQVLTAAFYNFDRLIQQSCFAVAESWASTAWNDDANRSCAALLYLMVLQTTSSKLPSCGSREAHTHTSSSQGTSKDCHSPCS